MDNQDLIKQYISECEQEYRQFMGITDFPQYELMIKDLSAEEYAKTGYLSWANAGYDFHVNKYRFVVSSQLLEQDSNKYCLFHEMTHLLDDYMFVNEDIQKYVGNHGFTEYHASQVELMLLCGASSVNQTISFSMNDNIDTLGGKISVSDFVDAPYNTAEEFIASRGIPAKAEVVKTLLGVLFNYYGRRSICKMYAVDYTEKQHHSHCIRKWLRNAVLQNYDYLMQGWFPAAKVMNFQSSYTQMLCSLVREW